ncbi:MAG: polyribonucleotide nucleotidyltransferase, partial [Firmicutes bacterium]|nr:polyribonucleotide nucleotidyltransferase [Bacillota bacterium]
MEHRIYKKDLAGTTITVEVGKLAEQANGSCTVQCGDTIIFVAVTASKKPREGMDFFPLSVDFEEKLYAVGRIPGGFIKREGRQSEKAILTSRLIDRPIRPLFPEGYRNDVVIIATALSIDPEFPPEVFAMIGSSVALSISDIPFSGPTGSVVVGMVDGQFIINPNSEQRAKGKLNLVVSGTKDAIMMVEAGAQELSEAEMLEAIMFGHEHIKELVAFQEDIIREVGKQKLEYTAFLPELDLDKQVKEYANEKLAAAVQALDKQVREENMRIEKQDIMTHFADIFPSREKEIDAVIESITKESVRRRILDDGVRPDGRSLTEIRPLSSE